jgi:ATP-binding cassette, subfamily B, multidrug efflux pump
MVKIFKNLNSKEWTLIGISLIFIVLQVWLDLKLPEYMSSITRLIQTPGSKTGEILAVGGRMLLCALGSMVASIIVAAFAARIAANLSARLRSKIYSKVQNFSLKEINDFSTASLITRSTNDITQVQMFVVMGLQVFIKAPILAVWAFMKIMGVSWQWTLAMGISVIGLIVVLGICIVLALPKFKLMQKLTDDINRVTRENLTGIRVVRAYNAERYQEAKFEKTNTLLTDTNLFTNRIMAVFMPTISLVMNGLTLAIYWIGAVIIQSAAGTVKLGLFSDMIVFSSYAMQILMAFMMLVIVFILLPRASVAAKRINEVLGKPSTIKDGNIDLSPSGISGQVEFRNVSFKYPDAEDYVIRNVSFVARRGETVAIIGSTGCGKSTVLNLIPRFYDVTEGGVLVDGVNVKDYTQTALRNKLGYVSQRAVLFKGTVASNIAFGSTSGGKVSGSDVVDAVFTAQASDFVEGVDGNYDGYVALGGINFSGGQKQRLSIARAIARHPEILIFDDSFSALDYKTDRKLRSVLKKEMDGTTVLIVAQRIGTIKDADRIIVLENGNVVGNGTHEELMKSCNVYQEIAFSQLSKEELA